MARRQARFAPNQTAPTPLHCPTTTRQRLIAPHHGSPSIGIPNPCGTGRVLALRQRATLELAELNIGARPQRGPPHRFTAPDPDTSKVATRAAHTARPPTAYARPTTATNTESSTRPMAAACAARQPQTERKSALNPSATSKPLILRQERPLGQHKRTQLRGACRGRTTRSITWYRLRGSLCCGYALLQAQLVGLDDPQAMRMVLLQILTGRRASEIRTCDFDCLSAAPSTTAAGDDAGQVPLRTKQDRRRTGYHPRSSRGHRSDCRTTSLDAKPVSRRQQTLLVRRQTPSSRHLQLGASRPQRPGSNHRRQGPDRAVEPSPPFPPNPGYAGHIRCGRRGRLAGGSPTAARAGRKS
jgi:hypothetical protein